MLFFELLQVALNNRERLSKFPSDQEWEEIYDESGRQAVTGVLLHGIDRLPAEQRPSKVILLQWIGEGQIVEQRNLLMDKRCVDLLGKLDSYGLRGTILKGQGIARLYDKELQPLRQSGDIDVFVECEQKKALEFAYSIGQKNIDWDYKHLHLNVWDDTEVEMHYRVEVLLNLWKNRKLQKWFKEHENEIFKLNNNLLETLREQATIGRADLNTNTNRTNDTNNKENTDKTDLTDGFVTPTIEFNVFYILLHIYRHFLYEGVGLRQIVDYYYVLKANTDASDKTDYAREAVRGFRMEKFARGLMWVMKEALGMPEEWMLWEPDKKEGEYILKQVMTGGNFGHYDERLKHSGGKLGAVKAILTHNLHILTHYPSDVIWAPVWILWHKMWKTKTKIAIRYF